MTDIGSAEAGASWPLPKFYFDVSFGDRGTARFAEVSELKTEVDELEYRQSNASAFSGIRMPGRAKFGNVTLKKGVLQDDGALSDWFAEVKMNKIRREAVVIALCDEGGMPSMRWTLSNAYPTKVTSYNRGPDSDRVMIETLELAYESLTVADA